MLSACRLLNRSVLSGSAFFIVKVERAAGIHFDVKQYLLSSNQIAFLNEHSKLQIRQKPVSVLGVRFASTLESPGSSQPETTAKNEVISQPTSTIELKSDVADPIPEPPVPEVIELVSGEPPFATLGLGGWSPVGIIENCFEFLHISCGIPWWSTIVIGTIAVRLLLFPLVIIAQRNAAKMNNHLPQIQVLQMKMSDARERGDRLDSARYAQEMMLFMQEKNLNPLKNMLVPLAQAPFFVSFFMSLREMSNLPVGSMREGGLFWFTDLTVPDQFYLLPLITSATLALTVELGTDAGRLQSANLGLMKYFLRAMPVIIFPFTINFTGGVLVYWVSSNFISLGQVALLRIPAVREYFKIEKLVTYDKTSLPMKDKGFMKGVSESWTNMKLTKELEERQRIDEINFMRAGRGAVRKTYKFDPTKTPPPRTIPVQAKKRD